MADRFKFAEVRQEVIEMLKKQHMLTTSAKILRVILLE